MRNILLLISLLFFTFISESIAKNTTNILGKVSDQREGEVYIQLYSDLITFGTAQYIMPIKDGQFALQLELSEGVRAKITHGNGEFPIYLEPGDSLAISFNGWHPKSTLEFTGVGSENNRYLNRANVKFERYHDNQIYYQMTSSGADDFRRFMDKVHNAKLVFFAQSQKQYKLTSSFAGYALADIDYWWAYHLMRYRWEHAIYNEKQVPMSMSSNYFSFFQQLTISNDAAVTNLYYLYFIEQYINYHQQIALDRGQSKQPYNGAKKYLTGKPLYLIVASDLYLRCRRKEYGISREIEQFLNESPVKLYNEVVSSAYAESKGLYKGKEAPDFNLVDINGQPISLSQFKDKIVYIDFWATWCGPCVREFNESRKVKAKFKGKDVVFIYISLDGNIKNWKSFIEEHNPSGIHLYSKGFYNSPIAKKYSVRGIPSFFVVDKKGRLGKTPGYWPSDPRLSEEIEEMLGN